MQSVWGTNGGVYFGYGSDTLQGEPPPLEKRRLNLYVGDRHLVTVGPNGSGKSRRVLVPNLVALTDWSMLVVDPKGDLAVMTRKYREDHGSQIVVLNPFDAYGIPSDGFNPVAALDPKSDDFSDDAMGLAEALIRVEGKEPHFSQSAQDLVCALIMYVRIVLPNPSLADVRALLGQSSATFRETVMSRHVDYQGLTVPGMVAAGIVYDCPELEHKAARFEDVGPENRELLSVISTALTQTRWLDSKPIKKDLSRGGFDFSRMKEERITVYLILPARRLSTHSTWLRLIITSVLQSLMKDTRKSRVPTLLMLDEFAQLGHLPNIEQNLALMRGYGVKLWAVFQDFAQAKAIYDARWQSFLGNAGVLQAFAPQDVLTANELSASLGQKTITPLSAGSVGPDPGLSLAQIPVQVILPQDLRNMDDGFAMILSHKTKGPLRVFFPFPNELDHMKDIVALDPSEVKPQG